MNKTLNNITDALLELCVNHKMVNDFAVGDVADIGKKKLSPDSERLEYPYVWLDYDGVRYDNVGNGRGIGYKIYSMRLVVMDKYTPSSKNTTEVMSDTEGILSDFIQFLLTSSTTKDFRLDVTSIQGLPVRDSEVDGAEGWAGVIPFKIPYQFCATNLPM